MRREKRGKEKIGRGEETRRGEEGEKEKGE